jgi:hypothetical protein
LFNARYGIISTINQAQAWHYWGSQMGDKLKVLLAEVKLWSAVWAVAALIAGAGLGAILSGGEFGAGIMLGGAIGLIGGGVVGALLRVLLEGVWLGLAYLFLRLFPVKQSSGCK